MMGYFPRPPEGGQALFPYARRTQQAPMQGAAPGDDGGALA